MCFSAPKGRFSEQRWVGREEPLPSVFSDLCRHVCLTFHTRALAVTGKCEQQPMRSPPTIFSLFWIPNISAEADPNRSHTGQILSPSKDKLNILNLCGRMALHTWALVCYSARLQTIQALILLFHYLHTQFWGQRRSKFSWKMCWQLVRELQEQNEWTWIAPQPSGAVFIQRLF